MIGFKSKCRNVKIFVKFDQINGVYVNLNIVTKISNLTENNLLLICFHELKSVSSLETILFNLSFLPYHEEHLSSTDTIY